MFSGEEVLKFIALPLLLYQCMYLPIPSCATLPVARNINSCVIHRCKDIPSLDRYLTNKYENSPLPPHLPQETDDLQYEEELLRNPFSVKHWLRYTEHKKDAPPDKLNKVYERALLQMPGSYKLWHQYLR